MKNKRIIILAIASGVMAFCFFLFIKIGMTPSPLFYTSLGTSDIFILGCLSIIVSICVYFLGHQIPYSSQEEDKDFFEIKKPKSSRFRFIITRLGTIIIILSSLIYAGSTEPLQQGYYSNNTIDIIDNTDISIDDELIEMENIPPIQIVGKIEKKQQNFIIKECIEKQPDILLQYTQRIYLCSHEEFIKLRDKMKLGEAVAFATSINNYIYIDTSVSGTYRVVTHELAHNYDFRNGYISSQDKFDKDFQKMRKTEEFNSLAYIINVDYAKSDSAEFFAEVSDAYFNKAEQLKELYPSLYKYFDKIYGE